MNKKNGLYFNVDRYFKYLSNYGVSKYRVDDAYSISSTLTGLGGVFTGNNDGFRQLGLQFVQGKQHPVDKLQSWCQYTLTLSRRAPPGISIYVIKVTFDHKILLITCTSWGPIAKKIRGSSLTAIRQKILIGLDNEVGLYCPGSSQKSHAVW